MFCLTFVGAELKLAESRYSLFEIVHHLCGTISRLNVCLFLSTNFRLLILSCAENVLSELEELSFKPIDGFAMRLLFWHSGDYLLRAIQKQMHSLIA